MLSFPLSLSMVIIYMRFFQHLHLVKAIQSPSSSCHLPWQSSCEIFAQAIKDSFQDFTDIENKVHLIDDSRMTRLRWLYPDKCYALVDIPLSYDDAQAVCFEVNGRLTWTEEPGQVEDLISNAIQEGVLEQKHILVSDGLNFTSTEQAQNNSYSTTTTPDNTVESKTTTFKEAVWIGVIKSEDLGLSYAWDCPEIYGNNKPIESTSSYCIQGNYEEQTVPAALCQVGEGSPTRIKDCLCEQKKTKKLPFYCVTNSLCSVVYDGTCEDFHADLADLVQSDTYLVPNIPSVYPDELERSCFVLVVNKTDWYTAQETCINAGGRLAWLLHNGASTGAHLLNFTKQKNVVDQDGMTAWLGVERWEVADNGTYMNQSWWAQQWTCPVGKGRHHRFFEATHQLFGRPLPWEAFENDPLNADLSAGHLKEEVYPLSPIAFHGHRSKLLPYFCEVTIKLPPTTSRTTPTASRATPNATLDAAQGNAPSEHVAVKGFDPILIGLITGATLFALLAVIIVFFLVRTWTKNVNGSSSSIASTSEPASEESGTPSISEKDHASPAAQSSGSSDSTAGTYGSSSETHGSGSKTCGSAATTSGKSAEIPGNKVLTTGSSAGTSGSDFKITETSGETTRKIAEIPQIGAETFASIAEAKSLTPNNKQE